MWEIACVCDPVAKMLMEALLWCDTLSKSAQDISDSKSMGPYLEPTGYG